MYKGASPIPLREFIILHTEGGRGTERCSLGLPGDPIRGGEFLQVLKRGRRDAGQKNAGQECQTQNTTQHSWQADTFTMPERKEKCTLLYQQLFQCYGNVRLKKVNCRFCVASGGALWFSS